MKELITKPYDDFEAEDLSLFQERDSEGKSLLKYLVKDRLGTVEELAYYIKCVTKDDHTHIHNVLFLAFKSINEQERTDFISSLVFVGKESVLLIIPPILYGCLQNRDGSGLTLFNWIVLQLIIQKAKRDNKDIYDSKKADSMYTEKDYFSREYVDKLHHSNILCKRIIEMCFHKKLDPFEKKMICGVFTWAGYVLHYATSIGDHTMADSIQNMAYDRHTPRDKTWSKGIDPLWDEYLSAVIKGGAYGYYEGLRRRECG